VAEGDIKNLQKSICYKFEKNGTFEVCMLTEIPDCPEGVEKCQSIKK